MDEKGVARVKKLMRDKKYPFALAVICPDCGKMSDYSTALFIRVDVPRCPNCGVAFNYTDVLEELYEENQRRYGIKQSK